MKKLLVATLCLCALYGPAACSAPDDDDSGEKGRIEEFNKEVARDATNAIRRPLDKARGVQDLSRQHVDDLEQD
jgi:hypothetical protein